MWMIVALMLVTGIKVNAWHSVLRPRQLFLRSLLNDGALGELSQQMSKFQTELTKSMEMQNEKMEKGFADIKAEVADIKAEVADIKAEVADIKAEVADIKAEVADIKAEVADIKVEVADIKAEVADIKAEVNLFRGEVNERFLRSVVASKCGESFAKPFNVKGLSGLACLATVKKADQQGYNPRPPWEVDYDERSQGQLLDKAVRKLTDFIYDSRIAIEANLLARWNLSHAQVFGNATLAASNLTVNDPYYDLVTRFARSAPSDRKDMLGRDSGVGILFFTAALGPIVKHEIALDCRGGIQYFNVHPHELVTVSIGEIKSSRRLLSDAVEQASVALSVLKRAVEILSSSTTASMAIPVVAKCVIALPERECAFDLPLPKPPGMDLSLLYG